MAANLFPQLARHAAVVAGALACLLALGLASPAQAAPGDLDPTFSGDGKEVTDIEGPDEAHATTVQEDGKIVVAGSSHSPSSGSDFALTRYNTDGTLDISFGNGGKLTTDFGGSDRAADVAVQANGKIVVVGESSPESDASDFAVARYNPDGSLDPTFSQDGIETTDVAAYDQARGVVIQPNDQPGADGKIAVVGLYTCADDWGGCSANFALARYTADGTLDSSFSDDGREATDFGGYDEAQDVTLQEDGKLAVTGGSGGDFALARYNADGSLDTSFSQDGKQTTDFVERAVVVDVSLQADGKMVAAGYADHIAYGDDFALARYNADGSLDTTFSDDGKQETDFDRIDHGAGVAIQADGAIVVAGKVSWWSGGTDFALARYRSDGSLDSSFSDDGKQTTDFSGASDAASDLAIQPDGKLVAVGRSGDDFALARYEGGSEPPDATPPPEPAATPPAGTYQEPQSVSLSSETGASIHYTTDGTDPTSDDPRFDAASPIQVSESQTIKAIAIDRAGNRSSVASHAYTILPDYRTEVLGTSGLVSYWRLGETSGTTAADAKGANNGSYRNGVLLSQPSALLRDANPSARFDGSNDYVSVADHASLDTGDRFTLEAWVKRSSTSSSTKTVLSKGSGSWRLSFVNNVLTLTRAGAGTVARAGVATTDTTGFHHIVAAKSGAAVKLYIDGVDRTGSVTNRTIANTSTALNIGRDTAGSEYFPGLIDEVANYNVALSGTQVQQHFMASGR